jgi:hypothetical protein
MVKNIDRNRSKLISKFGYTPAEAAKTLPLGDTRTEGIPIFERHFKDLTPRQQKPYLNLQKRFKGMSKTAQKHFSKLWQSKVDQRQLADPLVPSKKKRSGSW